MFYLFHFNDSTIKFSNYVWSLCFYEKNLVCLFPMNLLLCAYRTSFFKYCICNYVYNTIEIWETDKVNFFHKIWKVCIKPEILRVQASKLMKYSCFYVYIKVLHNWCFWKKNAFFEKNCFFLVKKILFQIFIKSSKIVVWVPKSYQRQFRSKIREL